VKNFEKKITGPQSVKFFKNILKFLGAKEQIGMKFCMVFINGLTWFHYKQLILLYCSVVDKLKLVEALSLHEPMELTTYQMQMKS
jgi:hypothetical protein